MSKSQTKDTEPIVVISDVKSEIIDKSINKEKLTIGDFSINQDDLFLVGDAEIDDKGLVNHHLSSANDLYTNGITQIITQVFKVEKDIDNQKLRNLS